MPEFAVLIYAHDSAHAREATPDDLAEPDSHATEVVDAGAMVLAYALTPRHEAVSIRAEGVAPQPYAGGADIVAGFYVVEAASLEAAVALASTNPAIRGGGGVEVRPVHSGGVGELRV